MPPKKKSPPPIPKSLQRLKRGAMKTKAGLSGIAKRGKQLGQAVAKRDIGLVKKRGGQLIKEGKRTAKGVKRVAKSGSKQVKGAKRVAQFLME